MRQSQQGIRAGIFSDNLLFISNNLQRCVRTVACVRIDHKNQKKMDFDEKLESALSPKSALFSLLTLKTELISGEFDDHGSSAATAIAKGRQPLFEPFMFHGIY